MARVPANGRACRVDGKVPKDGFAKSRADRHDWICDRHHNLNRNKWRRQNAHAKTK